MKTFLGKIFSRTRREPYRMRICVLKKPLYQNGEYRVESTYPGIGKKMTRFLSRKNAKEYIKNLISSGYEPVSKRDFLIATMANTLMCSGVPFPTLNP